MTKLIDILNEIKYEDLKTINTWEDLKKIFKKYKYDLKYLSEYEGQDINNLLGSGGTGKVFRIGNTNRAIKISQHYKDGRACEKLLGKNPKNLIKIYDVKKLEHGKNYVIIIIMELCFPLPSRVKKFINLEKKIKGGDEIDNTIELGNYLTYEDNKVIWEGFEDLKPQFDNIRKELKKYNITEGGYYELDVRPSNFLINSEGNITFVDIVFPFS